MFNRFPLTPPSPYLHPGGLLASSDGVILEGELVLPDDGSAVLVSDVCHYVHVRRPHLKLSLPVDDGGEGRADQERPFGVTLEEETRSVKHHTDEGHQRFAPDPLVLTPPGNKSVQTLGIPKFN